MQMMLSMAPFACWAHPHCATSALRIADAEITKKACTEVDITTQCHVPAICIQIPS